ncbi:MAG: F0F1 ATP synthase subunit A [Ruminococcaceae bacterium]|nr:F0F1 ATP synthase subunit A [Oscillospiraceae bacterium]
MTVSPQLAKLDLGKELAEELSIEEVFSFDLFGMHITVDETTVVSWVIIAVMTVLALILTRNLKVEGEISRRQAFLEMLYEKAEGFFKGLMNPKTYDFIPWLMSMALFIGISNIIGIFGPTVFGALKPPTKSMQVTAAMAITSIIIVEYANIRDKGIFGRIKAYTKPIWIITPINLLEIITKPLSLCMRLFGNVLAAFTIMELIKIVTRNTVIPIVFSLYFDLFDGLLQAYIFVFLTSLYLAEATEEEEEEPKVKKMKKRAKKNKKALETHS